MHLRPFTRYALLALLAGAAPVAAQAPAVAVDTTRVDSIFARFAGTATPGCAVGVSHAGRPVLSRAYGMADLEHGVPNTPATIFEAGSVSKQFTAAAVILLAQEGRLSLEDDVRRHFPELPDYGETITVRHLLNHTSGLRDWGSVAAIGGWPRGTRVYTHDHVLEIAARQRSLNYRPGEHYSYTNTGYNLLAELVTRAGGTPFADFSRARLFQPLGLASTSWRDDYQRVVPGRAIAYRPAGGGTFRMDMPFENVHGNGGLLTTVTDLLRWSEGLRSGEVGGAAFVREMHRRGRLNGGLELGYASGLVIGNYRGVPEVSHSGATAGYRAFLARYPEQRTAVAVLCNAAHADAPSLGHRVAALVLGDAPRAPAAPPRAALPATALAARAGLYRDARTHEPFRLAVVAETLTIEDGPPLRPLSGTHFWVGSNATIVFDPRPAAGGRVGFQLVLGDGDARRFEPVAEFTPSPQQLADYVGSYDSDEAEATFRVTIEDGRLVLRGRSGEAIPLAPAYADAFSGAGGVIRFHRDATGRVVEMSASSDRVWDLRFPRRR